MGGTPHKFKIKRSYLSFHEKLQPIDLIQCQRSQGLLWRMPFPGNLPGSPVDLWIGIGQELGVSPSTICRELARNADKRIPPPAAQDGKYKAALAHQKCTNRHSTKPKKIRFTEVVCQQTEDLLKQDYSPEQVCPRDSFGVGSSELLIRIPYQQKGYISTSGRIKNKSEGLLSKGILRIGGGTLFRHLRHRGKRYRKRGQLKDHRGLIINRVDIEQRPAIVEEKNRLGDLEIDTVIGKNHAQGILQSEGFLWKGVPGTFPKGIPSGWIKEYCLLLTVEPPEWSRLNL